MRLSHLLLASLATAIPQSQSLENRADTIATGLFDVYNVAECVTTGLALQLKEYQLPNGPCVDTPPNPNLAAAPFLSFCAGVQGGVPAHKQCYFDVYAGAACTGNYQGFMSMDENNRTCQEVLVGTTGSSPTVGGSVKMSCFSA